MTWTRVNSLERSDLVAGEYKHETETEGWPRYRFEVSKRPVGFRFNVYCQLQDGSEWTNMATRMLDGQLGPVLEVVAWAYSKWGAEMPRVKLPDLFEVERPEGRYSDERLQDYISQRIRADDLVGGYTPVGLPDHIRPFSAGWIEAVYRRAADGDGALLSADELDMRRRLIERGVTPDRITEAVIEMWSWMQRNGG